MAKIYKDDYGTIFRVTTGGDITDATDVSLKIKKPDNSEVVWTADIYQVNPGIISYTTINGDLDQIGIWSLQAVVTFASGVWSGDTVTFTVYNEYK